MKREIRHFHVVVVQKWQENVQKQSDARALSSPLRRRIL